MYMANPDLIGHVAIQNCMFGGNIMNSRREIKRNCSVAYKGNEA